MQRADLVMHQGDQRAHHHGHALGDQALIGVTRHLSTVLRAEDTLARIGGEEFALIFPETNLPGAIKVADSLRRAVAMKEIINRNTGDKLGRITLSGGAAQYTANESIDDLIERADAALYTAKHNGRNQVAASPGPKRKAAG